MLLKGDADSAGCGMVATSSNDLIVHQDIDNGSAGRQLTGLGFEHFLFLLVFESGTPRRCKNWDDKSRHP